MNSREVITALLNKQIPDRMGLYEHYWPETLRDVWPEQGYPKDQSPENYFGYDIINCGGWFDTSPFIGRYELVEETDEWYVAKDGRGASLKYWKKKSGTPEHIAFDLTSPEKWPEYREPLLATDTARLGDMPAVKAHLENMKSEGRYTVFSNIFVFEAMRGTIGDQEFLPALLTEPEWIRDYCEVHLDMFRRHYEIFFREVGVPDGFFLYEDFGYNKGLFASPKVMAELIMPYEKQLVSFFKDYGMQVILHSCGDVREAIPLIIDAGFDCLQPMEAKAGCNVLDIASTYGNKIAYMGNMNVVPLSTNEPLKVEAEILPKLNALKKMRIPYIFHSDHSIPPDINLSTYKYALELLRENWEY